MAETAIVNAVRAYLKRKGAYVEKNHGSPFVVRGRPDLEGCLRGRYFAFEVKRPGQEPTDIQRWALEQILKAGGLCAVVHSLDEAKGFLHAWGLHTSDPS